MEVAIAIHNSPHSLKGFLVPRIGNVAEVRNNTHLKNTSNSRLERATFSVKPREFAATEQIVDFEKVQNVEEGTGGTIMSLAHLATSQFENGDPPRLMT